MMALPFTALNRALKPFGNLLAGRCWPRFRSIYDAILLAGTAICCSMSAGTLSDQKTNTLPILSEVTMNQMLLMVSSLVLMTGVAFAEAETPVIDQRQANQEQRIDQGIASGQLNK